MKGNIESKQEVSQGPTDLNKSFKFISTRQGGADLP